MLNMTGLVTRIRDRGEPSSLLLVPCDPARVRDTYARLLRDLTAAVMSPASPVG